MRFVLLLWPAFLVALVSVPCSGENLFQPFQSPVPFAATSVQTSTTFAVTEIPSDIDRFQQIQLDVAKTPAGGAAMFVLALLMREQTANGTSQQVKLGQEAVTVTLAQSLLVRDSQGLYGYAPSTDIREIIDRVVRARPYIIRSYIEGTSSADFYRISGPIKVRVDVVTESEVAPADYVVFVHSTGTAQPRAVEVVKDDSGIWRVYAQTLLYDVAQPDPGKP